MELTVLKSCQKFTEMMCIISYRPIYTISICTSLGFTPEMRDACPNVCGLIFLNFCNASVLSEESLL